MWILSKPIGTILVLLCILSLSRPAEAKYGGRSGMVDAGWTRTRYVFLTAQSTVTQTGGIAGVDESYSIKGEFYLTVNFGEGTAFFDVVDAELVGDSPFLPTRSLADLFNMTGLIGKVIDQTTIVFFGQTTDGTDGEIWLLLTAAEQGFDLKGLLTPGATDLYTYGIEASAEVGYGGGSGTPDDPYKISTPEDLMLLGETPGGYDKHFILIDDIDLDPNRPGRKVFERALIAPDTDPAKSGFQGTSFTGVFDGNGHAISHVTIMGKDYLGLFGRLASGGEVKDLGVVDVNMAGSGEYVAGLVAANSSGTVTRCYSTGSVSGGHGVGGLVGRSYGGLITTSYSTGAVSGSSAVGGLVGDNWGNVMGCYSTGAVTATNYVGGLVGSNSYWYSSGGVLSNCYSTGAVSGNDYVGGLVGGNGGTIANCYSTASVSGQGAVAGLSGSNEGIITNCYSVGSVTGTMDVGGLVGLNDGDTVTDCFWDTETSGQTTSTCGTGLTTPEMQTESTFIAWAEDHVWTIDEGVDYPRLLWENKPGKLITKPPPPFGGGSGTKDDPFLIYTPEQLNSIGLFRGELGKHFKLMADIDLAAYTGTAFNIIGNQAFPFSGVFDGNGKKILKFNYTIPTRTDNIGLFGYVSGVNAQIKDLGLIHPDVDPNSYPCERVGSLVGCLYDGTVTNCYVEGASISCGESYVVGGLVGYNSGTIVNCTSSGSFGAGDTVGGLVGYNDGGISECNSSGDVGSHWRPGGLAGTNSGVIFKCYSSGEVWADHYPGGLVGLNDDGIISNCYSTGIVGCMYSAPECGGLVGDNSGIICNCYWAGSGIGEPLSVRCPLGLVGPNGGTVTASFWDIETSGQTTSGSGTGKTTAEMKTAGTFLNAGWDFVGESERGTKDVWAICEGVDYPHLAWEFVIGDFDADADTDFADFCILAEHWLAADGSFWCGQGGSDFTNDGVVDFDDLKELAESWLAD